MAQETPKFVLTKLCKINACSPLKGGAYLGTGTRGWYILGSFSDKFSQGPVVEKEIKKKY